MNKSGQIIVIEDNTGDQFLFEEIFRGLNLKNEIVFLEKVKKRLHT